MSDLMKIEQGYCVNCGENNFKKIHSGKDRLHGLPGEFSLDQCCSCGLHTVHPRLSLTESAKYYPSNYISYPIAPEDEKSFFSRWDRIYGRNKRCREILKRVGPGGRVLDIGCATGIFLSGMQKKGWECYGLEPSEYAAQYAHNRFGLEIFNGYLDDAPYPENFFDLITLWDVLEHLPDPAASLKKIQRLLKPGGWLVLSLPNTKAWECVWFGKYWVGWDVPRHYNIFSPDTIIQFLNKCDFITREIASFTGRHGAMVISLEFLLNDQPFKAQWKKLFLDIMRSIPVRIITYPYYSIADLLNRSSVMNIFAQQKI